MTCLMIFLGLLLLPITVFVSATVAIPTTIPIPVTILTAVPIPVTVPIAVAVSIAATLVASSISMVVRIRDYNPKTIMLAFSKDSFL